MSIIDLKKRKRRNFIISNEYYIKAILVAACFLTISFYLKILNKKMIIIVSLILMTATLYKVAIYIHNKFNKNTENNEQKNIEFRK